MRIWLYSMLVPLTATWLPPPVRASADRSMTNACPRMHRHPYDETFVADGEASFTVGDDEIVGSAGQIIVCPAQVPHEFAKTGTDRLEMIDVHASPVFHHRVAGVFAPRVTR